MKEKEDIENDIILEDSYSFEDIEKNDDKKNEAKKNGFLLAGKTGAGKSTLLNIICEKDLSHVEKSANSGTKQPSVYYHKLKNGKYITIIDTPGLCDIKNIEDINEDNKYLTEIKNIIKKENIYLKGILFLINFQEEHFDFSQAQTLLNFNTLFPLKNFWKYILIIFTHAFGDPNGDSLEEKIHDKYDSNKKIFSDIMKNVEKNSDIISYEDLNKLYLNSYWPVKKDIQKKINRNNKIELENFLVKYMNNPIPLCSRIIETLVEDEYEDKENGKKYFRDLLFIAYLDLNDKMIKEEIIIKNIRENKNITPDKPQIKISSNLLSGYRDKNGTIKMKKEKISSNKSYYIKKIAKLGIPTVIGLIIGILTPVPIPVGLLIGQTAGQVIDTVKYDDCCSKEQK